eukprot:CAMPEP_0202902154 /NCGR_PEP_ID=MMETSP1392-20130828/16644_1 /ASSEMBLY_ACC=CAM_ASM_000868 /TAXON_ID=225041 /ORGANISM="Chlamydomonas chlamydogama, Strain SAG 11-48b" /LENGTH=110 /DNA_ID=CAMNT_0049588879 /DNA_START=149 /DNA_END=481 /DNA_ORIENTATION=-
MVTQTWRPAAVAMFSPRFVTLSTASLELVKVSYWAERDLPSNMAPKKADLQEACTLNATLCRFSASMLQQDPGPEVQGPLTVIGQHMMLLPLESLLEVGWPKEYGDPPHV